MSTDAPNVPWVRLNAATFTDARLIRAGFWGGVVWVAALTMAKLHGWRGGRIPKDEFDAALVAHHLNAVTSDTVTSGVTAQTVTQCIDAATLKLVSVGLLEDAGTHWQIRGWAKYQSDKTGAERSQRHRDKNKEEDRVTESSRSNDDGTGRTGRDGTYGTPPTGQDDRVVSEADRVDWVVIRDMLAGGSDGTDWQKWARDRLNGHTEDADIRTAIDLFRHREKYRIAVFGNRKLRKGEP